jgi:hypothetical protein
MNDGSQRDGSWDNERGRDGKYDVERFLPFLHGKNSVNRTVLSFKFKF